MRKILILLLGLLMLALPAAARAGGGQLDRTFGGDGKVTRAVRSHRPGGFPGVGLAISPNGEIVVAAGKTLYAFLSNGDPDRRFGRNGEVTVAPPAAITGLTGIAVDSKGRIDGSVRAGDALPT